MEIQELISYYLYEDTKRIEVSFRLTIDSEDEIRNDIINLDEAEEFGYDLIQENLDFFQYDDEFEEDEEEKDVDLQRFVELQRQITFSSYLQETKEDSDAEI